VDDQIDALRSLGSDNPEVCGGVLAALVPVTAERPMTAPTIAAAQAVRRAFILAPGQDFVWWGSGQHAITSNE
jgi:hypothetical protein